MLSDLPVALSSVQLYSLAPAQWSPDDQPSGYQMNNSICASKAGRATQRLYIPLGTGVNIISRRDIYSGEG